MWRFIAALVGLNLTWPLIAAFAPPAQLTLALAVGAVPLVGLLYGWAKRRDRAGLAVGKSWRYSLGLGLSGGALMTGLTYLTATPLLSLLGAEAELARLYQLLAGQRGLGAWAVLAVAAVVVGEELLWRGLWPQQLEKYFARAPWRKLPRALPVVVASSLLYALGQAGVGSLLLVGVALACGLFWSGLRQLTGGWLAPLTAHLLWDAAVLFVWPLG